MEQRVRARELGIPLGRFRPGKLNAVTDVAGVQVGHSTIIRGAGPLKRGRGPVRTGVTAILPNQRNIFEQRVPGGGFVLNGAGEVSGLTQLMEWGLVETPIFLTNTLSVGAVSDAAVQWMVEQFPGIGNEHDVLIPLVGECDDSWLNDSAGRHVAPENVYEAIQTASDGPVAEGAVGAGTGMVCFGWKGGIGTSSRLVPSLGATVGVLVLANFGAWSELRVDGVPVGRALGAPDAVRRPPAGSCIVVLATDAPLGAVQLQRVARRAGLGLARSGSVAHHGSGEIFLAFASGPAGGGVADDALDPIFACAVEATEEAVLNALWFARDVRGRDGRLVRALPHDDVVALLDAHGRLDRPLR